MPVDPKALPGDPETLQKIIVDLTAQLDRTERLLRQLLEAKTGRKSEQLSREQLALFAEEAGISLPEPEDSAEDHDPEPPANACSSGTGAARGRKPLSKHLKRERIEHDLPDAEKHCSECHQALRKIGEEVSERYEYLPAQMKVIEDACFTYACACTVKTASKPPQPIEKSTASASVLAHVIVSKLADHLPLHRQAKMFRRHGVEIAVQTLCGWMAQSGELSLSFIWASEAVCAGLGSRRHRRHAGEGAGSQTSASAERTHLALCGRSRSFRGGVRLHGDAGASGAGKVSSKLSGIFACGCVCSPRFLFLKPERGMVEVGCWSHARRHVYQALENDSSRMRTLLLMIAELY